MNKYPTDQLNMLVNDALETLKKDRDKEVLKRRGGIDYDHQTLERIGQDMGITRERVRQIEKAALNKVRTKGEHEHDYYRSIKDVIDQTDGLASFSTIIDQLGVPSSYQPHAIFLIKSNPKLVFLDKNDNHDYLVADVDTYSPEKIKQLHDDIIDAVKQHGKPAKFVAICKYIDGPHSTDCLTQLALASNHIANIDELWGLSSWPEVNPKSIRDKIYVVLKKYNRPMHFSEISDKISSLEANPKKVTTQAVHNELIKDSRFVLIGRGIYALDEWGYKSGTVADIIKEVLENAKQPLDKNEIIKQVLARRQVKTTTILLNLQEKPQFKRISKGVYALA